MDTTLRGHEQGFSLCFASELLLQSEAVNVGPALHNFAVAEAPEHHARERELPAGNRQRWVNKVFVPASATFRSANQRECLCRTQGFRGVHCFARSAS